MIKKIGAAVAVVLVLVMAGTYYLDQKELREQAEHYEKLEEELAPFDKKLETLEDELRELEKQYEVKIKGVGSVVILFDGVNENVYKEAYPLMKDRGYKGTLITSEEQYPGGAGCMSEEQFQELTEAGWTVCDSCPEDAFPYQGKAPKYKLEEAVKGKGNVVFTVGFEEGSAKYDRRVFTAMLDTIGKYCAKEELLVMGLQEAADYRQRLQDGSGALEEEYQLKREDIEKQIEEVNGEIRRVNERYE